MKTKVESTIAEIKSLLRGYPDDVRPTEDVDVFTLLVYNYVVNEEQNLNGLALVNQYSNYFVNGANDGGIDMLYYDDKSATLGVIQTKYSPNIDVNNATAEIEKIIRTLHQLQERNFAGFSQTLKKKYLELESSISDTEYTYEIILATTSEFNKQKVESQVKLNQKQFGRGVSLNIVLGRELEQKINTIDNGIQRVTTGKLELVNTVSSKDIEYTSKSKKGIFVSAQAKSIKALYDNYEDKGLFDLNVRKYIKRVSIDNGIIHTIQKDPSEFWFLNNGLTIATSDYAIDGNVIHLYDFSVVNGAQTTTLIAKKLGEGQDFAVPVKVIAPASDIKLDGDQLDDFFSGVSEATNSQKPIRPQDLKANTRELRSLHRKLKEHGIFLKIKQGVKPDKKYAETIKIEDFAKLIYSFVNQAPGSARSKVRSLFESKKYDTIFVKPQYDQSENRIEFLQDLIDLYAKVDEIQNGLIKSQKGLTPDSNAIFRNGKLAMMALLGLAYTYVNEDAQSWEQVKTVPYRYGAFLRDTTENFDNDLRFVIQKIVQVIQTGYTQYQQAFDKNATVTNYLKKDTSYATLAQTFIADLSASEGNPERDALYPSCTILKRDC